MNQNLKKLIFIGASLICNQAIAGDEEQEIQALINTFKTAILEKDVKTFESLFYSDDIPWIAVFSDEMLKTKRQSNKDYPKTVNFAKFGKPVDMLSGGDNQEEKISNIKIVSDGYLASVHFDYKDCRDGKQKAYGTESWGLIRDDESWKIVSVTYSVTEGLGKDKVDYCAA